nr:ThiF family adenylyltransferase [Flavobacterium sp. ASV13]
MERLITDILSEDLSIKILTSFSKKNYFYEGKIEINYLDKELEFEVLIPKNYPLTLPNIDNISITFKNTNLIGYNHINNDGSVCFHPKKDDNLERKLKSEISGLKKWIKDYYIGNKEEDNYTYLLHNSQKDKSTTLFFSDNDKKFKKDDFGTFEYSVFTDRKFIPENYKATVSVQTLFRIGFNEYKDKWSSEFLDKLKLQQYKGFWIYIGDEPIYKNDNKRKSVEKWNDLEKYLSTDFIKYLYDNFKGLGKTFFFEQELCIILGYKIPNNENYEIHWDLIKIPKNKLPIYTVLLPKNDRALPNKKYIGICNSDSIIWGTTNNCNYERFFGRGKLTQKLINSRILIIGCGALGSSLAEILVRGGCTNIILEDFDSVGSGNLCRSKYNLLDIHTSKIDSLKDYLLGISPYVNIVKMPFKMSYYLDLENGLNQGVNYIFDCSTDTEVTYILDKINFEGQIFSLSITNHAKELVCVNGKNITARTNDFYNYLENEEPLFYEGTGCGYPTFQASYNDINSLLNPALANINLQIDKDNIFDNFIIRKEEVNGFYKFSIDRYNRYVEQLTKNCLYISEETLIKIKSELDKHYPNEFGGVFVGFKENDLIIVKDILLPDKYENGKTVFIRHPGTLNERLQSIFEETSGKIIYLGEWHSHPDASPMPSQTDIKTMKEIAENNEINNINPLLMISKISNDIFESNFFLYNNNKLLKYG